MRAVTALFVAVAVALTPGLAAQQPVSPAQEIEAWRQMAAAIPPGSRVKVQTRSGRQLTATLMTVDRDAIVVKRDARLPEPAVTIPFSELAQLRRDERSGFSVAKALGVGLAAGVGAIVTLFAFAAAIDD